MVRTVFDLVATVPQFVVLGLRSHARLAAENLFLRKQLAQYLEREANTASRHERDASDPRRARAVHRVAAGADHRAAGYARAVAPSRLAAVVALEISAPGTSADSART